MNGMFGKLTENFSKAGIDLSGPTPLPLLSNLQELCSMYSNIPRTRKLIVHVLAAQSEGGGDVCDHSLAFCFH